MYKVILTLIVIYLAAFSSAINAQTVVLINGEPTKVLLDKTSIVEELNDDVSEYLIGFDTKIPEDRKFTVLEKKNELVFQHIESIYVKESRNLALSIESQNYLSIKI